eukprot:6460405-Amphidinium_carterae.2
MLSRGLLQEAKLARKSGPHSRSPKEGMVDSAPELERKIPWRQWLQRLACSCMPNPMEARSEHRLSNPALGGTSTSLERCCIGSRPNHAWSGTLARTYAATCSARRSQQGP